MQENQRGTSTTATLLAGGVEVRVKASQDLMQLQELCHRRRSTAYRIGQLVADWAQAPGQ
jgi:hypothetical protein